MIYWFTGQPGHGKTVLAKLLKEYIEHNYLNKLSLYENLSIRELIHIDEKE
jgi:adenylylsulfate kinase-like enzyme